MRQLKFLISNSFMRLISFIVATFTALTALPASAAIANVNFHELSHAYSYSRLNELGPRLNYQEQIIQKEYWDWFERKNRTRYFKVVTYDVQGNFEDRFRVSPFDLGKPINNNEWGIQTATITLAGFERHRLVDPTPTFHIYVDAATDKDDPSISASLESGQSIGNPLPTWTEPGIEHFNRHASLSLADGSDSIDFNLLYRGFGRHFNSLNVFGPAYDFGIHHVRNETFFDPPPVPEPSTWLMLLGGGLLLGALRRKRA